MAITVILFLIFYRIFPLSAPSFSISIRCGSRGGSRGGTMTATIILPKLILHELVLHVGLVFDVRSLGCLDLSGCHMTDTPEHGTAQAGPICNPDLHSVAVIRVEIATFNVGRFFFFFERYGIQCVMILISVETRGIVLFWLER
jgi:hypothetical protein